MFSIHEGEFIVKSARKTLEEYLEKTKIPIIKHDKKFDEKMGVFVTLETYPDKNLRGCIGYPQPSTPFWKAMQDAAINAAEFDPRFNSVQDTELKELIIEVTVLSPPKLVEVKDPKEYLDKIKIGKHGLIAKYGSFSGLLLPQVPVEQKWGVEEFLNNTCWKANMSQDMWKDKKIEIFSFEGQIFSEESPKGKVIEKKY